jgi:hypothetical protein
VLTHESRRLASWLIFDVRQQTDATSVASLMKLLSVTAFLGFTLSAFAGIIADTVLVSADDIRAGTAPLSCSLVAEGNATLRASVALKESIGVPGTFGSIEFRIMPDKIDHSTLKTAIWDLKRIERRGHTRAKSIDFQLSKDELPRCLVLVSSWTGERDGMSVSRSAYIPLSALIAK